MHPSPLHLPYILFEDCISVQTGMECNNTPSPTFTVYTLWRVPEAKLILHVTLHLPRLLKKTKKQKQKQNKTLL